MICTAVQLVILLLECLSPKDWISFGHKFHDRCALDGVTSTTSPNFSPIFLQFLDCVYQLSCQFPRAFAFGEEYLLTVAEHAYSGAFGTFLENSEKQRLRMKMRKRSPSLWLHLSARAEELANPLYQKTDEVLLPRTSVCDLTFWKKLYLGGGKYSQVTMVL